MDRIKPHCDCPESRREESCLHIEAFQREWHLMESHDQLKLDGRYCQPKPELYTHTVVTIDNPPEVEIARDLDNGVRSVFSLTTSRLNLTSDGKRTIVSWLSNNLWTCRACAGGPKLSVACAHRKRARKYLVDTWDSESRDYELEEEDMAPNGKLLLYVNITYFRN
jgi:hypothetical protein